MPTDKENVSFLYSMIRQLETKHINWKTVAFENDVSNDHAARMRFHRLRLFHDKITPGTRKAGAKGKGKGGKGKGDKRVFGDVSDDEEERRRGKKKLKYDSDEDDDLSKHRRSTRIKKEVKKSVKNEVKNELAESTIKAEDLLHSPMPTPMAFYAEVKAEILPPEHVAGIENEMKDLLIKREDVTMAIAPELCATATMKDSESNLVENASAVASAEFRTVTPSLEEENDLPKDSSLAGNSIISTSVPPADGKEFERVSPLTVPAVSTVTPSGAGLSMFSEAPADVINMEISTTLPCATSNALEESSQILQTELPAAMELSSG